MYTNNKPNWHTTLLKIFPLSCVSNDAFYVRGKSATIRKSVYLFIYFFTSCQSVLCWPEFKEAGTSLFFFFFFSYILLVMWSHLFCVPSVILGS